jgi:integration host factor subunit beta
MTKADLVVDVMRLGDLTRTDAETIIETIFDSVVAALRSGDKIEIRGFGSFRTRQRNPRIGRNPKTGARVDVPSKRVPYFKPSKDLRDLVNHQATAGEAKPATAAAEQTSETAPTQGFQLCLELVFGGDRILNVAFDHFARRFSCHGERFLLSIQNS